MSAVVWAAWLLVGPAESVDVATPPAAPANESAEAAPASETAVVPAPAAASTPASGQPSEPADSQPSAPATTPVVLAAPTPDPAATQRGRFVYAWWMGLNLGIFPIPSFSPATVFLGGRTRGPWAVGYQIGLSLGGAERYWGEGAIPVAHRHHVTGMRSFGRNRRGLVAVGGGAAFVWPLSPVVEAETRVAVRFGSGRWHLGGLVRLGWDIGHREYAPMPQFGLFIGTTSL